MITVINNLKIRVVFAALILLLNTSASAQHRSDHWYFGDSAAIHFTDTGLVASMDGSLYSGEGCASMSDTLGNLLFYTNGWRIWNRNGDIMPNGDSIVEWSSEWELNNILTSVTQATIILPYPEHEGKYVVFTNQSTMLSSAGAIPPRYSVIDMNLDGGLGDIEIHEKSKFLQDSILTVEKLCATKHANGRDWWILLWGRDVSSSYGFGLESDSTILRFLLTPEGLSYLGPQYVGYVHNAISQGEMVFSQQGDKLAIAGWHPSVEVRWFDRCTGLIGSRIFLDTTINTAYGAEFSPDGKKLYVSSNSSNILYQYNLELTIQDSVFRTVIIEKPNIYKMGQLQLGPDNRIYFGFGNTNFPVDPLGMGGSLSVINEPNLPGINCDLDTLSIDLHGKYCIFGLPNQPNYELGALVGSDCDTLGGLTGITPVLAPNPTIFVYPQPASETLTVIVPELLEGELQIEVFDRSGRLVEKMATTSGSNSFQISVEELSSGLYILKITDQRGKILSQTITVQ